MPITSDEAKSIVFAHIDKIGRESIRQTLSSGHGAEYLRKITASCRAKIRDMGGDAESEQAMLTAILHFTLSLAAVPSHRKVEYGGVELDVVIPDLRTLQKSPELAMVVCVASAPGDGAVDRIAGVLDSKTRLAVAMVPGGGKTRHITYSVDDSTFENVIQDARAFLASSRRANFGMIS